MLWPEEFAKFEAEVQDDAIVFLRGTMNRSREPAELVVSRIIPVDRAAAELARGLLVTLHKGVHSADTLESLRRTLANFQGNLDVFLELPNIGRVRRAVFRAAAAHRVRHDESLLQRLEDLLGPGNVRLLGSSGSAPRPRADGPAPAAAGTATPTLDPADDDAALEDDLDD
jgi:DNA polymerase-3 subunit alpha